MSLVFKLSSHKDKLIEIMVSSIHHHCLDIYVMMVSGLHNVCKKGFYIAILSTNVETNNPEKELEPAFEVVGPVLEKFFTVIIHIYITIYHTTRSQICMYLLTMVRRTTYSCPAHSIPLPTLKAKPTKSSMPSDVSLGRKSI